MKRGKQQEDAVKAAKEAGVKHIIYTSFERRNETETSPIAFLAKAHIDTEKNIKESGMTYTILRNNLYADILPMFLGEKVLETGVFFPAGDAKVGLTVRSDMAEAAANILTSEGHENKDYFISNTENVSLGEIAENLSQLSGKNITYTSPDSAVYVDTLSKAGVPAEYTGMFAAFGEAMKQGEFNTSKTDLENLLGRKPTSVKEFLAGVYAS
jgi:NAD(P)H dehydrogenase (quinone)